MKNQKYNFSYCLMIILLFTSCHRTPGLVKDPWDNSSQPRFYRLNQITNNSHAANLFKEGCLAVEQKQYSRAIMLFSKTIKDEPRMWEALYELARAEKAIESYDLSLEHIEQAASIAPDIPQIQIRWKEIRDQASIYYLNQGEKIMEENTSLKEAEPYLKKALEATPNNFEVLLAMGHFYLKSGKGLLASHFFQTVLNIKPENKDAMLNLIKLYIEGGDFQKSTILLKKAIQLFPDDSDFKSLLLKKDDKRNTNNKPVELLKASEKKSITRADLAALLITILEPAEISFKSLPPLQEPLIVIDIEQSWARDFIRKTLEYRLMQIFPNHKFRPNAPVYRYQFAGIIYNIIKHTKKANKLTELQSNQNIIKDVSREHNLFNAIFDVVKLGFMECDENHNFFPDGMLNGERTVTILQNLKTYLKGD